MNILTSLGVRFPIIQAPMAGVSTAALAVAVSKAGGLGSIGIGASSPETARKMIQSIQSQTDLPFQVNLFVHTPAQADQSVETEWLNYLRPAFSQFGATPPSSLRSIYKSFSEDGEMLQVLLDTRPPVVSFHFGLPSQDVITTLKSRGTVLMATATNLEEARAIEDAGIDVIVAQGYEAGGHRGIFDPSISDPQLGTLALTRLVVKQSRLPVIAAGGIMDGASVRAVLDLGAVAAQLGTAFIGCPESAADDSHRAALNGEGGHHTTMTAFISGRPARSLANRFTSLEEFLGRAPVVPTYPIAYDAGKALHALAKSKGESGYGAQWAGQGAPLSRAMPALELVNTLVEEMGFDAHLPSQNGLSSFAG